MLTPLLLGFSHTFDEKSSLTLEFSNKFTRNDQNDRLVDLLEQSVSMGKKLDLSRDINAFQQSNAHTVIDDYINNMLDLAVKAIISEKNEVVSINENGVRLMKWADGSHSSYDPHQIWMTHGGILFTDTAWEGVKDENGSVTKAGAMMGIGHFVDDKLGEVTGVIAPNIVGSMLAGEQLYIYGKDVEGRNATFTIDGTGVHSTNMNQIWDSAAGQVAVAPEYGIIAGLKSATGEGLFKVQDGKITPVGTMDIIDGKPTNDRINVWIGTDGTAYFKGKVFATGGEFDGDVYGNNYYFRDGSSVRTLISKTAKGSTVDFSNLDYINLGGIVLDGRTGNINFTGAGSITWGNNAPVKYQFAQASTGPWHSTMQTTDKYRRDSLDGGTTWGPAYQFRGTDGKNGSDASVTFANIKAALQRAASTQTSFITVNEVGAPNIYGGNIYGAKMYTNLLSVYPDADNPADDGHGIEFYGVYGNDPYKFLRIRYSKNLFWPTPGVVFESPAGGYASWDFTETKFNGRCDFSDASVTGIHLTLA